MNIAQDEDDMALQALLSEVDRPMSPKVRERVRALGRRHFGPANPDAILAEGETLGRYRIERILGVGGQAVVYLARHLSLPARRVALKVPHGDSTGRLLREADVMARLDHPGILGVVDVDGDAHPPYLVLEHCVGGSLADRVEAQGPLPEEDAAWIAREVLTALAFAHESGVVHRDLKPENVLFNGRGQVRIADFGLGKVVAEQLSLSLSQGSRSGVAGTPVYMAPEQERPGAPTDARADLYAVGKLIYFMLTAQSPRTLRPVERDRPDVEPEWTELVFKLTESHPDARPTDALEVLEALEGFAPFPEEEQPARALPERAAYPLPAVRSVGQWLLAIASGMGYLISFFLCLAATLTMIWGGGKSGVTLFIIFGFFMAGSSILAGLSKPAKPPALPAPEDEPTEDAPVEDEAQTD